MRELRAEQRLELTRMIREEHRVNRGQMKNREQIVYGETGMQDNVKKETGVFASFRIRFALAVLLFFPFFAMERSGTKLGELEIGDIVAYVNKTWDINTLEVNLP